ncbi:hypothetical protein LWF15_03430 [Kineosporia rhizophila]|uniref:hypothetical protein n=1 Tax=Kineosporia rhizophila TaxID=84633 RepID=UPI001E43E699|nr:hypothetical protein [Kineosporia rhizophila]MCE0534549.1 hypothetical protein [Kineosporia rhizophila]
MKSSRLPPRGPAVAARSMLQAFDVDCGELVPGHNFIARGLAGPYELTVPQEWDGDAGEYEQMLEYLDGGGYLGFSLEYELAPGVPPQSDGAALFRYLVGIQYEADVPLPWEPQDGGAIAPFTGGDTTHGSRGDWPLPPQARVLTFSLYPVSSEGFTEEEPAGHLVVDLQKAEAHWRPAG